MRVVYATDNYWPRVSGMATSIDTFKHELEQMGHEVHILASEYPGSLEQDRAIGRQRVHRFRSAPYVFSKEDYLVCGSEQGRVFELLDDLRPDVIHVQTEIKMGRIAWRYAARHNVPLVMTCHTYFEQYIQAYVPIVPRWLASTITRHYTRNAFNRAGALVVPTVHMKSVLQSYGVDVPTAIIPTGFQHREFQGLSRAHERRHCFLFEKYPQLRGRKVLLTVGRAGKEKNLDFLLEVVERLRPRVPEAIWLLVGDGPYREGLLQRARQRQLEDCVVAPGYIPRSQIKHVFGLGDVFIFASKTESQGLVTVEAMSCGIPVVAIGEMGTRDVMNGDHGGFMVDEDADVFAERVFLLLAKPRLHQAKSQEALQHSRRWTARAQAEKMSRLYQLMAAQEPLPADLQPLIEEPEMALERVSAYG